MKIFGKGADSNRYSYRWIIRVHYIFSLLGIGKGIGTMEPGQIGWSGPDYP